MTSGSASRVTHSRRSLRLSLLLFAGVLAGAAALRAQETAPTPPGSTAAPAAQEPRQDEASAAAAAADVEGAKATNGDKSKPAAPASSGPTPERFEPTEKVRADFDVSFPIDI